MKFHYKGKYDLNPESLPHGEHMPGAVKFKEVSDTKKLAVIANSLCVVIMIMMAIPAVMRCKDLVKAQQWQMMLGCLTSMIILFPHEILHAICFKEDVYLYTNWFHGLLFVVGPETMSKGRFIFMSLLPNFVFGLIPYVIGMIVPHLFLVSLGVLATGMGAGDYYNVINAVTQMPKGARTYLYQFNSYWYLPD